jgi:hypothetical protein
MRHIPDPPSPHTPVKPRGSALIPLVTPRPIPGPAVLTPGSSLGSYIVPTDQHESFVRTLSSLMRTRENFSVGHPSQIAPSQARLTWRFFRDRLPKKKMHLVDMITLLILLSLGPGNPIPGARISQCRRVAREDGLTNRLTLSPSRTLVTPTASASPWRRITRVAFSPLVFRLAPTHLGWGTHRQFYSSVQGPPRGRNADSWRAR